ncbi:MAG: hypothetical protein H6556_29995 [Lewinellaceae bacterium]|nr:hypothetical protein [Lewinellaceae bacterium]
MDSAFNLIDLQGKVLNKLYIGLMNWDTKEMKILTDTAYQYQQAPVFVQE